MEERRVWVQSSETRRQRKDSVERGRELAESPRPLTFSICLRLERRLDTARVSGLTVSLAPLTREAHHP